MYCTLVFLELAQYPSWLHWFHLQGTFKQTQYIHVHCMVGLRASLSVMYLGHVLASLDAQIMILDTQNSIKCIHLDT